MLPIVIQMINEDIIDFETYQKIKQQLVPNYDNLDLKTQQQIKIALNTILKKTTTKADFAEITRKYELNGAPLLKSHLWKLLLGVLEGNHKKWAITKKKNSELYKALKNKFISTYIDQDDLLDFGTKVFDQQLWDEITLDTKRTHSNVNFFQNTVVFGKVYVSKPTRHSDILTRILYIWGKTNSTVRYVQGMNEILAPIYFLQFQNLDKNSWDRQSQVFFVFSALMSFVIDMHIKQMDDCDCGIMGRMRTLNRYLRIVDKQLWDRLESEGIYPQYYSFRWLALFLAQQFELLQTVRLWDFVFSYDNYSRFFFVDSVCVAILLCRKKQIMQNDFTTSLPLIQKLKDLDLKTLIKMGSQLYKKYQKVNIDEKFTELTQNKSMDMNMNMNMNMEKQGPKRKEREEEGKEEKQFSWNYADLLKSTTNYLSKLKHWTSKDPNK